MNKIILTLLLLFSNHAFSKCDWSKAVPIRGDKGLVFQECLETKTIKIGRVEVKPTISYKLNYDKNLERNTLWSKISPDKKTAVVYLENNEYKRNAWIINLGTQKVELFTDVSVGKHYIVEFKSNSKFTILHGGMGYRTDYYYSKLNGIWKNTGHEDINVNME